MPRKEIHTYSIGLQSYVTKSYSLPWHLITNREFLTKTPPRYEIPSHFLSTTIPGDWLNHDYNQNRRTTSINKTNSCKMHCSYLQKTILQLNWTNQLYASKQHIERYTNNKDKTWNPKTLSQYDGFDQFSQGFESSFI
jgi:hypothetical protein